MTMYEVVHELVLGECHKPNFGESTFARKNVECEGFWFILLVLLEYHIGKGIVCATSREFDRTPHW